jgi:hypothetical protein
MFYIKSAVEAVDGDLSDIDGLSAALRKADFPSMRGEFEIGPNHYPDPELLSAGGGRGRRWRVDDQDRPDGVRDEPGQPRPEMPR